MTTSHARDQTSAVRAPDVLRCWYLRCDAMFVVAFVDGERARLPAGRVEVPPGAHVVACAVDEFRRGVEVALDDGSTTSFSADFVLYATDPTFRRRVDAQTNARRKPKSKQTFGQRVRAARTQLGWTLKQLAERVGMAAPNVHRIETGSHTPSTTTVLAMSKALDRSLAWLIAGDATD